MTLPRFVVPAGTLLQHVSRTRYRGTALHFGCDATCRYDAPDKSYGVLYLGFDLATALMESVFHKHRWSRRGRRNISQAEVSARMVRAVGSVVAIELMDLTAPGAVVRHFGLNLTQLASRRYVHTQRISKEVWELRDHAGTQIFDGILYPSRNNYPEACIALFESARPKVTLVDDIDLADHVEWPQFVVDYKIGVVRPYARA